MALLPTTPLQLLALALIYVTMTSSGITGAPLSEPQFEAEAAELPEKRTSLSISQELGSLADRYNNENRMQQLKEAESLLLSLGKRGGLSVNQAMRGLADQLDKQRQHSAQAGLLSLGKRDGEHQEKSKRVPVSINQSLGPLSSMMQEQGAANAQHMLASLGKRAGLLRETEALYPRYWASSPRSFKRTTLEDTDSDLIGSRDADVKRAPLSIGQELRLVGGDRRTEDTMNFLQSLGKRSTDNDNDNDHVRNVKRSPLSVSVPMNTLSNMLIAERRKYSSQSAQQALNALG